MEPHDAKREISNLTAQIRRHEKLYRLQNAPEISDAEFDRMMRRLRELEESFPQFKSPDSPTERVGSDLDGSFEEVEHLTPMQSLDNVFDADQLRDFDARLRRVLGLAAVPANAPADSLAGARKDEAENAADADVSGNGGGAESVADGGGSGGKADSGSGGKAGGGACGKGAENAGENSKKNSEESSGKSAEIAEPRPLAYCVEPKIDGAGISAVYENGRLMRLLTRGNGREGNDISTNAFLIRNLPLELKGDFPALLEARGECYMTVGEFERIRAARLEEEQKKLEQRRAKERAKLRKGGPQGQGELPNFGDSAEKSAAFSAGAGGASTTTSSDTSSTTTAVPAAAPAGDGSGGLGNLGDFEGLGGSGDSNALGDLGSSENSASPGDSISLEKSGDSGNSGKVSGYANPRNLAAGTMKLLPKTFEENPELKNRELLAVFYSIGACEGFRLCRQSDLPATFKRWGLPCVDWFCVADGVDSALEKIAQFDSVRRTLPYNTDGAVLKLDDVSLHSLAGATDKAPRWAIAWKYPPERRKTRLKAVTLQVGRTGVVTPVAELEEVDFPDSKVSRATLHNAGYIAQKDIRVGDVVVVEKAGEIIPAVVEVDKSARPADSRPYEFPENCPECGAKLARFGEKMLYRCPNFTCPPQVRGRLAHFASRGCMDIEGLGDKMTAFLVENFGVASPADLYGLTAEKLLENEKFRDGKGGLSKTGANLLAALEDSKRRPLWRLIFGLGILEIGAQFAKELSRRFGSLDAIMNAPLSEIMAIENFGSKAAKDAQSVRALSIRAFFDDSRNRETIERLRACGLNFAGADSGGSGMPGGAGASGGIFAGKAFAITGRLESMDRMRAQALIESLGGRSQSAVSSKTDYLIASPDSAGSKLEKARELGVEIIDEARFLQMLAEGGVRPGAAAPENLEAPNPARPSPEGGGAKAKTKASQKRAEDSGGQMSLF